MGIKQAVSLHQCELHTEVLELSYLPVLFVQLQELHAHLFCGPEI